MTPPDNDSAARFIVVGIGASAGGVRALKDMFAAVPPDSGMAYVVILHLSPDHESHLAEVLQTAARVPVQQVSARTRIAPDRIYVVSPNRALSLAEGYIEVSAFGSLTERRAPVDMFFRTLAQSQGGQAASVILSGTGANGSMGMKFVKENGGICIVQEPGEAEFRDMPRNAIATGMVDYVLPAADIPQTLIAYRRRLEMVSVPLVEERDDDEQALVDIFTQLRLRTGHGFTGYKRSTVLRRLQRRMNVREVTELRGYARLLRETPEETRALLRNLLVSVTSFFRDPAAFEALERFVIPRILRGANDNARIWVAGCATGEEAYSIAMLLSEQLCAAAKGPNVHIFATDIDEVALAKARAGLYTLNDAAYVSPERLRRFFLKDGEAYRIRPELREMVLFASHNVVRDPPFSHLDLIACRNLLIYLNRGTQERVLRLFHFGLKPGGYLMLGSSESADESADLFVSLDQEQHIYQSRGVGNPLPEDALSVPLRPPLLSENRSEPAVANPDRISYLELHQRLLEHYAPPSLVVNQAFDVLHLSERVGRYLQVLGGEPSRNILRLVRPELRLELHGALYQAIQTRGNVDVTVGPIVIEGGEECVKIGVRPVFGEEDTCRGMILVVFESCSGAGVAAAPASGSERVVEPVARRLEEELLRIKAQLRNSIEQHEVQAEELKASNEELQAMNEEQRSSTEELEMSREELQSVNEELSSVNQELKIKIEELSLANNDIRNLINSTELATLFVDRDMRIRLYTARASGLFNVIPSDVGRSLLDITHKLHYPELVHDIETVLDRLSAVEREVRSLDDAWYIARALPYRTSEDRIAGVVLTFTDITSRKRSEDALRTSELRVRLMLESIPDYAVFTLDLEGRITTWNSGAVTVFGFGEKEAIGSSGEIIFTPEDRAAGIPEQEMRQAREAGKANDERWHQRKNGSRVFLSGVMAPLVIDGQMVGYTKIARDLTSRRQAEDQLRRAQEELEARVEERTRELADANDALRREMLERAQSERGRLRLVHRLVTAQEDERARISRELHDQLGQEIAALSLKLAQLRSSLRENETARAEIVHLESIVKNLDRDVDFLVWELRPTGLDDLGLSEALFGYANTWSQRFGIPVQYESNLSTRLPAETETVLYRVAQEALNNVAKHAQARSVELILTRHGREVSLTIVDDGAGFDDRALARGKAPGLGLTSMRERAALIGGSIAFESQPGVGTTVVVRVPAEGAEC